MLCVETVSCWLGVLGHETADYGTLGVPQAISGLLVGDIKSRRPQGSYPPTGEARFWDWCQPTVGQSWILGSGCKAQGSQSWCQIAYGWSWLLTQLALGPSCFEACGNMLMSGSKSQLVLGQDLACLWVGQYHRPWCCGFLVACICPLVGEAPPEATAASLMDVAVAQVASESDLLVGRPVPQAVGLQFFATGFYLLVGETGPEVREGLLLSETRAQSVPVYHLAYWSMDWICRI